MHHHANSSIKMPFFAQGADQVPQQGHNLYIPVLSTMTQGRASQVLCGGQPPSPPSSPCNEKIRNWPTPPPPLIRNGNLLHLNLLNKRPI